MKNDTKLNVNGLLTKGQDAAAGAALLGPILLLAQNTAGAIGTALAALRLARDNYDTSRSELRERRKEVAALVVSARVFLTMFRELLKTIYGKRYSRIWDDAGFVGLLAIPKRPEDIQPRLQKAVAFLLAHPEREVAALNITAAYASGLFAQLSAARGKVHEHITLADSLLATRNTAASAVRHRLRGLIQELSHILSPLDPRWKTFGFNPPGAKKTPDAPENVSVVQVGNDAAVKWPPTPRAEYYHVWKRVIGVDAEPVMAGRPADPDFTIEDLPPNAQVEIAVSAVNSGGESALSAAITWELSATPTPHPSP